MSIKKALSQRLASLYLQGTGLILAGLVMAGLILVGPVAKSAEPPLQGIFAGNFTLFNPTAPAPTGSFTDLTGSSLTLADYKGKTVLLNFWATWCAPCIHEMPSLDALQTRFRGDGLQILAVSLDRGGLGKVVPFKDEMAFADLDLFLDPKGKFSREFQVYGLPVTYLIGPDGKMIGSLVGPADWNGPEAEALIRHYLPNEAGTSLIKTGG
ncbi:MAG: TlpA disulfide reductase family protein [Pseudomonadota bacterium]